MKKNIYVLIFLTIFIFGIFLRFYQLGMIPNSLNWDEVSWGYNGYSILQTGQDEYGKFMPLSFEAFGDYKQPVYVYLVSMSIRLFGLNPFTVRFPSALLGVLTIPFVWLLVLELFRKERNHKELALLAMMFFAISPWSIQFSRVAFEANIGLFFVIAGAALFLRGLINKNNKYLYSSLVPFIISGYSYHSEKIFTPLFFIGLLIFSYLRYNLSRKFLLILFIIFLFGSSFWIFDARTTARGRSVTFLSNQTQLLKDSVEKIAYDKERGDMLGEILNNRRIVYANKYFENYLQHFAPNFLFITGDNARHHAYGMGILYIISLPLILIGMIRINKRDYWFIFFWLLLSPAASALATDSPNASRSLIMLPTWQIFEAFGLLYLLKLKKSYWVNLLKIVIIFLLCINFVYFAHQYFVHTKSEYGSYWQYGYKEAIEGVKQYANTPKKIIFSKEYEQPYIFYLFYNAYNPKKYIDSGGSSRMKKSCFSIDNAYFEKCLSFAQKGDIYVSMSSSEIKNLKKIKDIKDLRGNGVGYIYEFL